MESHAVLFVEMPDAALRWAGPAMCGDEGTISGNRPIALPASKARELCVRLANQGRRHSLYRRAGRRLILTS